MNFLEHFFYELKYGARASILFLTLNILIFLVAKLLLFFGINNLAFGLGGSTLEALFQGQIWRLITAGFLHIEIWHLGLNMLALFYYGRFVENFYGWAGFVITYILGAIAGTFLSSWMYPNGITLGASTAIWAFLALLAGNAIRLNRYSPGLPIDFRAMFPSMLIWLMIGFTMPGISGWGHIGGFIIGVILGIVLPTLNSFEGERKFGRMKYSAYILLALTVFSYASLLYWLFVS